MDCIYVREDCVGDPILAELKALLTCRRTSPLDLIKEHFVFTYNEGRLRYTTKSLFDVTLLFVAKNIHCVDSLVGFPEQIGHRLFAEAEENGMFFNRDIFKKAVKLFNDAYGDIVLRSLCLRNGLFLLRKRIYEVKSFHSLKSLDLFGCGLGNDHEIFQYLTSTSLANLIQLFLGDNNLSNVGLQRLTAPIRIMRKGLDCLQLLDVSYNPISVRALRYFKCLPQLLKLDVSGTKMMLDEGLKTTMWNVLGLIRSEKPLDTFDHSGCKTEGWAEQVVNQWKTNDPYMPIEDSSASALRFYGRPKFIRTVLNAAPLVSEHVKEPNMETLHFCKPATNDHVKEKPGSSAINHRVNAPCCNIKKRKQESSKCDASHQSPPTKRSVSSGFTTEDVDLLNSY